MKARYIRISTPDQKLERQLVKKHPDERLYIDVCSGTIPFNERVEGKKLLSALDLTYVSVHAIDRLGRNVLDILKTLEVLTKSGINLKVDNLGLESLTPNKTNNPVKLNKENNPVFKLIISVLANISEMERNTMLERQREGINIAKANGVYKGRVLGSKDSAATTIKKYPDVVKGLSKGLSLRDVVKYSGASLGTVQKVKSLL